MRLKVKMFCVFLNLKIFAQKIPAFLGLGFRCYSKVSPGRKVFAGGEFRFKLPPLAAGLLFFLTHSLPSWTRTQRPRKRKVYLKQVSKRECRLWCGLLCNSQHSPTHRAKLSGRSQRSQGLGLSVRRIVVTVPIRPRKREVNLTQTAEGSKGVKIVLGKRGL